MRKLTIAALVALAYTAYTSRWIQITLHYLQQLQHDWPNTYVLNAFPHVLYHFTNKPAFIITAALIIIAYNEHRKVRK